MLNPTCPKCQSNAIGVQMPDSPEVLPLHCRTCGHRWEVQTGRYTTETLLRLAPLPHWR